MPSKEIIIRFAVPLDHLPGDYAVLYSNNGDGAIDWTAPLDAERIDLFPGGAGNYGFGMAPFGQSPFGMPWPSQITAGFGQLPFGLFPFGVGAVLIERRLAITECGSWRFALACYDKAGNLHEGTPAEAAALVHVAAPKASDFKKKTYNTTTGVLTLQVSDPFAPGARPQPPSRITDLTDGPFDGFTGRIDGPSGPGADWTAPELPSRIGT